MKARTVQNLMSAMKAEAFASAEFLRFAAAARLHEDESMASLFDGAADVGRCQHFAREAELAHLARSEDENLKAAIEATIRQLAMYDEFIGQAQADGDQTAVGLLEKVRHETLTQLLAFHAAQRGFGDGKDSVPVAATCPLCDQRNKLCC
jgi:rubrerythrin